MKRIGVVGLGYVGKAVEAIFSKKYKVESFDIKFDAIGAFASGLCMVHCIATPFFL